MLIALALLAGQVPEATIVSAAPASVVLTVYRAPNRASDSAIDTQARDQQGYALVTETRTVAIPAGPATLRFEGVAGNIFAETAILTGLPEGVVERNMDADLLSPRTLYDRALGRRVIVRRTDPATGQVREEHATIRSSAAGAAVLQLAGGIEALRCSGLPETILQTGLPDGLVARPTLSIRTASRRATTATVTLSYLAGGFDWQADYVVTLRPDGRADLFAWVTLASSDVTPFVDAATSVIAGKPKREERAAPELGREDGGLVLRCWPESTYRGGSIMTPPPVMMAPPPPAPMMEVSDIVVTGMKRVARQENLGDLKLYRLPEPTTVAARSQKQVAMLVRDGVTFDAIYVSQNVAQENAPVLTLRTRNTAARGLGVPLPAGSVAVFEGERLLGEAHVDDRAVGETVEIALGEVLSVSIDLDCGQVRSGSRTCHLIVGNDRASAIHYEGRIALGDGERIGSKARLARTADSAIWTITVPANARATLDYVVRDSR
ncbi:DUF4139 domain-containing protein [Sphingomonas sp.]|uniref:DUF4139 domain-containing protein n=1 Tax=Sphingomonas sp. TaxID=28214 RepID=UPI0035BC4DE4